MVQLRIVQMCMYYLCCVNAVFLFIMHLNVYFTCFWLPSILFGFRYCLFGICFVLHICVKHEPNTTNRMFVNKAYTRTQKYECGIKCMLQLHPPKKKKLYTYLKIYSYTNCICCCCCCCCCRGCCYMRPSIRPFIVVLVILIHQKPARLHR